jgi:hypothetical protein
MSLPVNSILTERCSFRAHALSYKVHQRRWLAIATPLKPALQQETGSLPVGMMETLAGRRHIIPEGR